MFLQYFFIYTNIFTDRTHHWGMHLFFWRCWKCSLGRCFKFAISPWPYTQHINRYISNRAGQELQFIEFFAGEANCFAKVKEVYPSAAVDFEYLSQSVGSHTNPFDIHTPAGLGSFGIKQWRLFSWSILFKVHSRRLPDIFG